MKSVGVRFVLFIALIYGVIAVNDRFQAKNAIVYQAQEQK